VLEVHVLRDNVAAPGAAAEARCHGHPVVEGARVCFRLWLADHDPAHRRRQSQAVDVVLVEGVDTAGVPLAADLEDAAHHLQGLLEPVVRVDGEQRRQLFAGEQMLLTDAVTTDDDELAIRRDEETSCLGQFVRRGSHGVRQAVSASHMTSRRLAFSSSVAR